MPEDHLCIPVIAGPTGVGKSRAAVAVAETRGSEIISADSRQVYRGLEIGTAAPGPELRRRVRHHLVGVLEPAEPWSSGAFAVQAATLIGEIRARGAEPMVVGGSGLYIRALSEGLFEEPEVAPELRAEVRSQLRSRLEAEGPEALYEELGRRDPAWAAAIKPTDSQRIVRGLEALHLYGVPLSELLQRGRPGPPVEAKWCVVLLERERRDLYERIERRVDRMIASGWVEEARALRSAGVPSDAPGLSGLGYNHLYRHLDGEIGLEAAVAAIRRDHRRYAKRQLTWFRSLKGAHRVHLAPSDGAEEAAGRILEILDPARCGH